jgi:hypothetical protein
MDSGVRLTEPQHLLVAGGEKDSNVTESLRCGEESFQARTYALMSNSPVTFSSR